MERKTILGYLEFFNELGMLFEDKEAMALMKLHVTKTFHMYELDDLFKVYKLISHNFYRDQETLKVIEDAIKIRVSD